MKVLLLASLIIAIITQTAIAQDCPPPLNANLPTYLGSFSDTVVLTGSKPVKATWNVCAWLVSPTHTEYSVNVATVSFDGDMSDLSNLTAYQIFETIRVESVRKGLVLGYASCSSDSTSPAQSGVTLAASVERTSSGFVGCSEGNGWRGYSYYCSGGSMVLTAGSYTGELCPSGCEATGPAGEGGGLE